MSNILQLKNSAQNIAQPPKFLRNILYLIDPPQISENNFEISGLGQMATPPPPPPPSSLSLHPSPYLPMLTLGGCERILEPNVTLH